MRRLGLRAAGGNYRTLHKLIEHYGISTEHFAPVRTRRSVVRTSRRPLDEVLVERSTYSREKLKRQLYDAQLKARRCELCGQGELWRGRAMTLILDHVNGVADDNRLHNLRIVCPNCAATLDIHCGRRNKAYVLAAACAAVGSSARSPPRRGSARRRVARVRPSDNRSHPELRKVERPPYELLMREIAMSNTRRYGVSDNAMRKWVRWYEADVARQDGESTT